jgi:hypothetical protein
VIWKGDGQDAVLFALKDWPALGLAAGEKKNLGRLIKSGGITGSWQGAGEKDRADGMTLEFGLKSPSSIVCHDGCV